MSMEHALSTKTCQCKKCKEMKPLDSFVRSTLKFLDNSKKEYKCIDCTVEEEFDKYRHSRIIINPKDRIRKKEETIVKRAFNFLFREEV